MSLEMKILYRRPGQCCCSNCQQVEAVVWSGLWRHAASKTGACTAWCPIIVVLCLTWLCQVGVEMVILLEGVEMSMHFWADLRWTISDLWEVVMTGLRFMSS
jgi:hypothetical protein